MKRAVTVAKKKTKRTTKRIITNGVTPPLPPALPTLTDDYPFCPPHQRDRFVNDLRQLIHKNSLSSLFLWLIDSYDFQNQFMEFADWLNDDHLADKCNLGDMEAYTKLRARFKDDAEALTLLTQTENVLNTWRWAYAEAGFISGFLMAERLYRGVR